MKTLKNLLAFLFAFLLVISSGFAEQVVEKKHYVFFAIDNSGSMRRHDPQHLINNYLGEMINFLDESYYVGVLIFGLDVEIILPLTKADAPTKLEVKAIIDRKIDYTGQWTNIPDAIERAIYDLKRVEDENAVRDIVLLTDGYVDFSDKQLIDRKRQWLLTSLVEEAKLNNIRIFGIAFSDEADFELVQTLSRVTSTEYYRVLNVDNMRFTFSDIEKRLKETVLYSPIKPDDTKPDIAETIEPVVKKNYLLIIIIVIAAVALIFLIYTLINVRTRKDQASQGVSQVSPKPEKKLIIPPARIIDLDKSTEQAEYTLTNEITAFGRSPENDIVISNDTTVSRYNHAQIIYKDNQFYIKDLSANYTKLNNNIIDKKELIELQDDSIISIMLNRFQFVLPQENLTTIMGEEDNQETIVPQFIENDIDQPIDAESDKLEQGEVAGEEVHMPSEKEVQDDAAKDEPEGLEVNEPLNEAPEGQPGNLDENDATRELQRNDSEEIEYSERTRPKDDSAGNDADNLGDIAEKIEEVNNDAGGIHCYKHPERNAEHICQKCMKKICSECLHLSDNEFICVECKD